MTFIFIWWFVYWVLFSTIKDALIANAIFFQVFWHIEATHPFLCFWVNQIFIFSSQRNIFVVSPRWIFISSPGFFCLPRGKVNTKSHPVKFLNILKFPQWVEQFPSGYWDRVCIQYIYIPKNWSVDAVSISQDQK